MLFVPGERFAVDRLDAMLTQAEKDYAEIWKRDPPELLASGGSV
jgi:hypothetical protein